ncbi:MAG: protein kinase [Proteobacteria bacterium]|nr:protein kinase [Pseudomonadota bacterium]
MPASFSLRSEWWEGNEDSAVRLRQTLLHTGSVIAGKYRIDGLLGSGGMGVVLAATHLLTGRSVALKWMSHSTQDSRAGRRFLREARAAACIEHPNVVNVFDVGRHEDSLYIVMERLRGETLHRRLKREPLSPQELVQVMLPVIHAVAAAHRAGIIHRDLKPENIFLCRSHDEQIPRPKVLDFGLAKMGDSGWMDLTHSSLTLGTPSYMAPEQAQGSKNVTALVDVYALGVTMYEALCGAVPFKGDNYNALIFEISNAAPKPLSRVARNVPKRVEEVVMRAMARDPRRRFQSVRALETALAACERCWQSRLADGSGPDRRPDSGRAAAAGPKSGLRRATGLLAATALGASTGFWAMQSWAEVHTVPAIVAAPGLSEGSATSSPVPLPPARSVDMSSAAPPSIPQPAAGSAGSKASSRPKTTSAASSTTTADRAILGRSLPQPNRR